MKSPQCQWFLKCTRAGVLRREHPRLGTLAICRRCNALVDHLEQGTPQSMAALERVQGRKRA
jgi:hypothetical protein